MNTNNQNRIITLITDFSNRDGFVGIMKAVMLNICEGINFVDISHEINPYDIHSAAFVLGQSYHYFPENTLHVVIIDTTVGSERKIIYAETDKYRFLAPDNSILQYVHFREEFKRVIEVSNRNYFLPAQSSTFYGRDLFAPVAAHLVNGLDPLKLGEPFRDFIMDLPPRPVMEDTTIRGEIVYIDHYGNLVSNISQNLILDLISKETSFHIRFAGNEIGKISGSFYLGHSGELIAYVDSSKFLSFAMNGQNAAEKLGLTKGDRVEIVRLNG